MAVKRICETYHYATSREELHSQYPHVCTRNVPIPVPNLKSCHIEDALDPQ